MKTKRGTKRSCDGRTLLNREISDDNEASILNTCRSQSVMSKWVSHNDVSYHYFSKTEAEEIRNALLIWYRENRRKLPWRGDPPPYNGSTAGTATQNGNGKKKNGKIKSRNEKETSKKQRSISSFFTSTKINSQQSSIDVVKEEVEEGEKNSNSEGASNSTSHSNKVSGYGVWVSEIMLQQTRVEAVIPYYIKWMDSFPTVYDLAKATDDEVNSHWAGLGFYRRARLLHQGAQTVVNKYGGSLPETVDELQKIDGIGKYTASAVASIAFDQCVPVVDGNVCRVLSRLKGIANHIKAPILKDDIGWELAKQIVEAGDGFHAGEVNQALMELGATYCAPTGSGIDPLDPLRNFYLSTQLGQEYAKEAALEIDYNDTLLSSLANSEEDHGSSCRLCDIRNALDEFSVAFSTAMNKNEQPVRVDLETAAKIGHSIFPLAPPKKDKREEVLAVAALECNNRWLLVKRPKNGLLAGQWEFPSVCVWTSDNTGRKKKKTKSKNKTTKTSKENQLVVPVVSRTVRSNALDAFLDEITVDCDGFPVHEWIRQTSRENVLDSSSQTKPIEHVFSHIRHTMYIERFITTISNTDSQMGVDEWTTSCGKEVRWMSETDMKAVGVTSGVKKILKLVKTR